MIRNTCFLLIAMTMSAQTPVFRSDSQLVEMSVVALDKKGQPVKDLKPEEIEIRDDGKRRDTALMHYEGAPMAQMLAAPAAKSVGQKTFSNFGERSTEDRHVIAVVMDALNTTPANQTRAIAYTVLYLEKYAPNAMVAVYQVSDQIRVVHDFTADGTALREDLKRLRVRLGPRLEDVHTMVTDATLLLDLKSQDGEDGAALRAVLNALDVNIQQNNRERKANTMATLNALNMIGAHLGAISGRKSMVWIGDGITNMAMTMERGNRGSTENWADAIQKTGQRLAQAGVTLYAVDAHGLAPITEANSAPANIYNMPTAMDRMETLEKINGETRWATGELVAPSGGKVIRDTNDLGAGLKRAVADLEGSYTLAFYSPAKPDGKWHPVRLKCNRSGVQLFARAGYLAVAPAARVRNWAEADWRALIGNPLPVNKLAVDAQCVRLANGQIDLTLSVAARQLQFKEDRNSAVAELDVAIAEKQANGEFAFRADNLNAQRPQEMERPLSLFRHAWKPLPTTTTVWLAVRDRTTGYFGVVDIPLSRVAAQR